MTATKDVVHLLAFVCFSMAKDVAATATVEVRMVRFSNPSGDKGDAHCCDICVNDCDNQFFFCLDEVRDPTNTDTSVCTYGRHATGEFPQGNSVDFGADMEGVPNPIRIQLRRTDTVVLKLRVLDNDPGNTNEWLDNLYGPLVVSRFGRTSGVDWTQTEIQGERTSNPTRLTLQYKGYCNANYYGELCEVFCAPRDSDSEGHYTCDPLEGLIECRAGWVFPGSGCRTKENPCTPTTCQNGGTCTGRDGISTCTCPNEYTGSLCEYIDECADDPCQNRGTCLAEAEGFTCVCPTSYTGRICERYMADPCTSQPCMNNGTCTSFADGYTCSCVGDYAGRHCERYMMDPCNSQPCMNNATCTSFVDGFICSCLDHYAGRYCETDTDPCTPNPCENDAPCWSVNGTFYCACSEIHTGETCAEELVCATACYNGGTCVSPGLCQCVPCYTGAQCDVHVYDSATVSGRSVPLGEGTSSTVWIAVGASVALLVVVVAVVAVVQHRKRNRRKTATGDETGNALNCDAESPGVGEPPASPTERYVPTPTNTLDSRHGCTPTTEEYAYIDDKFMLNAANVYEEPEEPSLGTNTPHVNQVEESYMETRNVNGQVAETAQMRTAGEGHPQRNGEAEAGCKKSSEEGYPRPNGELETLCKRPVGARSVGTRALDREIDTQCKIPVEDYMEPKRQVTVDDTRCKVPVEGAYVEARRERCSGERVGLEAGYEEPQRPEGVYLTIPPPGPHT